MRAWLALVLLAGFVPAGDEDPLLERARRQCDRLTGILEKSLGPKFPGPVPIEVKPRAAIRELMIEGLERSMPEGALELTRRVAERLHQIPPGYDLMEGYLALLQSQVAGMYDPDEDRFYVFSGAGHPGSPSFTITAAHELVHAYRDVDKDYWKRSIALYGTDADWAMGVRFLVEGDATLLGYAVGYAALQDLEPEDFMPALVAQAPRMAQSIALQSESPELQEIPLLLRETLFAAYGEGCAFAAKIYAQGGLPALEAAFDRPPRSTEQVLHPEKYLDDPPDEPTVFEGGDPTSALGEGWSLVCANVLGEFDLRLHFAGKLPRADATAAADGWDGCRYYFCVREGAPSFIGLVSTWDSEADAQEFARAWARWAACRDGQDRDLVERPSGFDVRTAEGLVVVRPTGADVIVADGVPEERVEGVLAALASARRRSRDASEDPPGPRER